MSLALASPKAQRRPPNYEHTGSPSHTHTAQLALQFTLMFTAAHLSPSIYIHPPQHNHQCGIHRRPAHLLHRPPNHNPMHPTPIPTAQTTQLQSPHPPTRRRPPTKHGYLGGAHALPSVLSRLVLHRCCRDDAWLGLAAHREMCERASMECSERAAKECSERVSEECPAFCCLALGHPALPMLAPLSPAPPAATMHTPHPA